jgi:hypothetical protein
MLTIFGGRIKDLEPLLVEERIPEGWESRITARKGLSMITFNRTVAKVESGTDETKFAKAPATTGETTRSSIQKKSTDAA